jgi:hypothetical protein
MKYGAPPAKAVEQLRNFELIHVVDGHVAHGLQGSLRPNRPSESIDTASLGVVERQLDSVQHPRAPRSEALGTLDHHSPRRNVDHPALVRKPIHVLNDRQIHKTPQAQTSFHATSTSTRETFFPRQSEWWLGPRAAAKFSSIVTLGRRQAVLFANAAG